YTATIGTTWYLAHVVALGLVVASIGIALREDRPAALEAEATLAHGPGSAGQGRDGPELDDPGTLDARRGSWRWIEPRQFAAGFLLGLPGGAPPTGLFWLPVLFFVGGPGEPQPTST